MLCYRNLAKVILFVAILCCVITTKVAHAQYQPPQEITLVMYRLEEDGSKYIDPNTRQLVPCVITDVVIKKSYGCTAEPNRDDTINYDYPFNDSTVTIGIENDIRQVSTVDRPGGIPFNRDVQLGYLHNVVTTELGVQIKGSDTLPENGYVPHSAIEAQAIAARTYAYHRNEYFGTIDNSNTYQVFVPFSYETLLDDNQKEDVGLGTARRFYMTESVTSYPLDAQYGADNNGDTTAGAPTYIGSINYLSSVQDPISAHQGTDFGTERGGMASRGARRWSYGHQSWTPTEGGDFWSVQWHDAFQILTHYYTGIHIRDANSGNAVITPGHRWVPLEISGPTTVCTGSNVQIEVRVQNTGTEPWNPNAVRGCGFRPGGLVSAEIGGECGDEALAIPRTVAPGDDEVIGVTIEAPPEGSNTAYVLDLYSIDLGTQFIEQNPAWPYYSTAPRYTVRSINCAGAAGRIYMPIVKNSVVTQ